MSETSLTIFNNLYDNKTDKVMNLDSFEDLEGLLYKLSGVERQSKKDSYLISPACYKEGTNRRCNENVSHWSAWAAMDIDDHNFGTDNLEHELYNRYGHYNFVCYSTASSTSTLPKFRMVLPLSRTVKGSRIRHFWYALNRELGDIGDPQTKDLSRMYYIPATYAGAYNFIFSNHAGSVIDPSHLMGKHKYIAPASGAGSSTSFLDRLPEALQKEIVKYRREANADGANVTWKGYTDCPFVNQNLIEQYKSIAHVDGTGRYSMIYKIMVSIASNAVRNNYPITTHQIVSLIRELDSETSNRYHRRPLDIEADRAIEFAYRNM